MDIPQVIPRSDAEVGQMGQEYLASGKSVALRRWEEQPGQSPAPSVRDYETVGYLYRGVLELNLDGEVVKLASGDSWLVPRGCVHSYKIIEPIVAIEATSPPARFNDRDRPVRG